MSDNKVVSSSSSSSSSNNKKSLLPDGVQAYLQKSMKGVYVEYSNLIFDSRGINDDMLPELCEWLIKLRDEAKRLFLHFNQITSNGASMLFDTLRTSNSFIYEIWLSGNEQINDECMKSFGEYIKSNKFIEVVSLCSNTISDLGIEILAPYFDGNTIFKELRLINNKRITDKSIPLLLKMIESSSIERMDINDTSITQKDIVYSSLTCRQIKYGFEKLNLREKDLNDDDMVKICGSIKKYGIDKLEEIDLRRNNITSKGASVLFDTLKGCNSVVSRLDLRYNQLDDDCMKQLGEYVQDNQHLEALSVGENQVTDKGIEVLPEYLIGNTMLSVLDLYGDEGITDASVPYLVEIAEKSCITSINIDRTSISDEKQKEIEEALSIPIEQREIPIKSNSKSAAKISAST